MRIILFVASSLMLFAEEPLLRIPPTRLSVDVEHQPVSITASGMVFGHPKSSTYSLSLAADLSDLQAHLGEILGGALNRSEDCGERITVQRATLVPERPGAVLRAEIHFERWVCGKALGKKIKKRVAGKDGVVVVALAPVLVSRAKSRIDAEVRDIQADGTLGELLRSGSLGTRLREKIRSSIESALDKATDFRATLPPVLQDLVHILALSFRDDGSGALLLRVDAEAVISSAQLQQLRGELQHSQ